MKRIPGILWVTLLVGAIFTGLFVASWVAFFWGDGDSERAAFCTAVAIFGVPLFAGSILVMRRRTAGLRLLKFGSVLFVCEPHGLFAIWGLAKDPDFKEFMADAITDGPSE